jgi:hypothetical protein
MTAEEDAVICQVHLFPILFAGANAEIQTLLRD